MVARLLIHFKLVKRSPAELPEINQLANEDLPASFELKIPGGVGELTILEVSIEIVDERQCLQAELLCNFKATVKQSVIYNTHLQLILEAKPVYDKAAKSIGVTQVEVKALNLISDEYSLIKDTSSLLGGLIPRGIASLIDVTVSSTLSMLEGKTLSKAAKYLSLYTSGSKQRIIDYHRPDIEQKIVGLVQSKDVRYELDEQDFEESLFIRYGEEIVIEDNKIYFVFG